MYPEDLKELHSDLKTKAARQMFYDVEEQQLYSKDPWLM